MDINPIFTFIKINSVALISLVVSIFCYFEYKKVNKIALKIDERTSPKFNLDIYESNYIKENDNLLYFFTILVTNLSDSANSLKQINLRVSYEEECKNYDFVLSPSFEENKVITIELTKLPLNIEGRNSKLIHSQFLISSTFKNSKKFLEYSIEIFDSFGNKETSSTAIINGVKNYD